MTIKLTSISLRLKKTGSDHLNFVAFILSVALSSFLLVINGEQFSDSIANNNGLYFVLSSASIIWAGFLFMRNSSSLGRLVSGACGALVLFIFLDTLPKIVPQSTGWIDFVANLFGGILISLLWSALPMFGFIILNIVVWFLFVKLLHLKF